MKDNILELKDINLSAFSFDLEKNQIDIELLDMYEGKEICTIVIKNIIDFKYENDIEEDILPAYIGELEVWRERETNHYFLKIEGWISLSIKSFLCFIN